MKTNCKTTRLTPLPTSRERSFGKPYKPAPSACQGWENESGKRYLGRSWCAPVGAAGLLLPACLGSPALPAPREPALVNVLPGWEQPLSHPPSKHLRERQCWGHWGRARPGKVAPLLPALFSTGKTKHSRKGKPAKRGI